MSQRAKILVVVIVGALAAAVLYLRVLAKRTFFEDVQRTEQAARAQLNATALESESGGKQSVTLYFPSSSNQGKLVAEVRTMTMAVNDSDRIRQIVLALIAGPTQGGGRPLPPSADVRAVFLTKDGTAYLDLSSSALSGFLPGIESETLAIYSIVNSLAANVPAVKRVKILVQGQEAETLDGHADLTGEFAPDISRAQ
jgi:type II secretory pathway pseudopilin PulG